MAKKIKKSTSTKNKPKPVTADKYNGVVGVAQLVQIDMDESHFKVEPEYFLDEKAKRNRKYKNVIKRIGLGLLEEEGTVTAEIVWSVRVRVGRKVALKINTTYSIIYTGLKEHDQEAVKLFVSRVAPVATYAYFRAHVAQLNWASNVDLPILPVYSSRH